MQKIAKDFEKLEDPVQFGKLDLDMFSKDEKTDVENFVGEDVVSILNFSG